MATATVIFPVAGAALDQTNPPALTYENSKPVLLLDPATIEPLYFEFRMPAVYSSAPVLKLQYKMMSAVANDVVLACQVMAVTPNVSEDCDSDSYDTANEVTDTVPGTAGHLAEVSIPLTNNDSMMANDLVALKIYRKASDGGDTATGDLGIKAASFECVVAL